MGRRCVQPKSEGPVKTIQFQAVRVSVPAKLSRSRFQPSCQGPGSSQAVRGSAVCLPPRSLRSCEDNPVPNQGLGRGSAVCQPSQGSREDNPVPSQSQGSRFQPSQGSCEDNPVQVQAVKFPDPRRVRSHRSGSCEDNPVPVRVSVLRGSAVCHPSSKSGSCEDNPVQSRSQVPSRFPVPRQVKFLTQKHKFPVPGSTTSLIPSIRLGNISSSSRIPRRVRSHRSDSTVQFLSRFRSSQGPVPFTILGSKSVPDSAIRVRFHQSNSVLLFSLRFQVPDRTEINCFSSWWFDSEIQDPSVWCPRQQVPLRSSGRLFIDLPRRPTLRTVRIRVLN